jgi:hypothetical protein
VQWVLMPGNHDHANAIELWRQLVQDAPPNVAPLLTATPHDLTGQAVLLPAPPSERHPGRDLTDWFDSADTGDALRIGLAHGSVTSFDSSEDGGSSVIAINRAQRAGLAYLGLGDWHGQLQIGPQTWYCGTPEADGFKHALPPSALLVEIAGAGGQLLVTALPTGSFDWTRCQLDLTGADEPLTAHQRALPPLAERSTTLFQLSVTGRTPALARVALEQAVAQAAPDFLWHSADVTGLGMIHDTADLDAIDQQGALRAAAETLARDAGNPDLPPQQRQVAETALSQLFTYALEV